MKPQITVAEVREDFLFFRNVSLLLAAVSLLSNLVWFGVYRSQSRDVGRLLVALQDAREANAKIYDALEEWRDLRREPSREGGGPE